MVIFLLNIVPAKPRPIFMKMASFITKQNILCSVFLLVTAVFLQLNYGENMECLLEGLVTIFEHIGGVPTEIWFDNTRTIVTKVVWIQ